MPHKASARTHKARTLEPHTHMEVHHTHGQRCTPTPYAPHTHKHYRSYGTHTLHTPKCMHRTLTNTAALMAHIHCTPPSACTAHANTAPLMADTLSLHTPKCMHRTSAGINSHPQRCMLHTQGLHASHTPRHTPRPECMHHTVHPRMHVDPPPNAQCTLHTHVRALMHPHTHRHTLPHPWMRAGTPIAYPPASHPPPVAPPLLHPAPHYCLLPGPLL